MSFMLDCPHHTQLSVYDSSNYAVGILYTFTHWPLTKKDIQVGYEVSLITYNYKFERPHRYL